jgi:hypothetical protein
VKRTASILLILLFLFNVGGYYFVLWGLRAHRNIELTQKLDSGNYRDTETVELKVRMQLPYVSPSDDFSRVKGKFEHNGNFYHLVKQKLQGDTLLIICIPDLKEKHLVAAMNDYAALANELPDDSKKAFHFLSKLLKEFRPSASASTIRVEGWSSEFKCASITEATLDPQISVSSPPPKRG